MILDRAGIGEDYHFKQDWGQDILRVGTSLGAGSIALEKNGKLYRVAPGAESSFEKVIEGPLRSVFSLRFDNWKVEDETYSLVHEISIQAGTWYYQSKVYFPDMKDDGVLIAGITTIGLKEKEAEVSNYGDNWIAVITHGPQAYDNEFLGLGILLKKENFLGYEYIGGDREDITNSFLVKMPVSSESPASFRFYSAWEITDGKFANRQQFDELLKYDALRMEQPIKISLK